MQTQETEDREAELYFKIQQSMSGNVHFELTNENN